MKKITVHSEAVYALAIVLLALAVSMTATSDFGISMIVAPAFILSQKLGFVTFGQSEYLVQGVIFILFCCLMKKVKLVYFSSFLTCLVYGVVLDLWRSLVPLFNANVTSPQDLGIPLRLALFLSGELLTALSIAMFFKVYLYPQVVDFFVKGVATRFHFKLTRFKIICDASMLLISVVLTLVFFGRFVGIGWGTLVLASTNGLVIGFFSRFLDRFFEIKPLFPRFADHFNLEA